MCKFGIALLVVLLFAPDVVLGGKVTSHKVDGTLPEANSVAHASGSGVIVGKRLVLTNRHVAQDDSDKPYDGFRVYLGPNYQAARDARVVAVCDEYDLALLETKEDLPFSNILVLRSLPPLSTRVTAYGFPLGSRFGVGITTSGGQISRHPVAVSQEDDDEDVAIKSSLWHDALLASGNSGGPLFCGDVLVGVNFGVLAKDGKYALAVPSGEAGLFLKSSDAGSGITLVDSPDASLAGYSAKLGTVYIEAFSSPGSSRAERIGTASTVIDKVLARLETSLPRLTSDSFDRVEKGDLYLAFQPVDALAVHAGDVARIRGEMMLIQVTEELLHVKIDGVRFFVLLPSGGGGELQAKLGDVLGVSTPVDALYLVGPATPYTTVTGSQQYAILLVPLAGLWADPKISNLLSTERDRRKKIAAEERKRQDAVQAVKMAEQRAERDRREKAAAEEREYVKKIVAEERKRQEADQAAEAAKVAEQRAKYERRYLARLRHTFTDASGKFKVDAAAVRYDGSKVTILRMEDHRELALPVEKLAPSDRTWLDDNKSWIRLYGQRLEKLYEKSSE